MSRALEKRKKRTEQIFKETNPIMSYKVKIITTLLITKVTEIETAQSSQISLLNTYVTDYNPAPCSVSGISRENSEGIGIEEFKHALFLLHRRGISRGASCVRDA